MIPASELPFPCGHLGGKGGGPAHLLSSKKTLNQVEATALPALRVPES